MRNPTQAEIAAAIITGEATSTTVGELVAVTARVPSWVVGTLDAIGTRTGRSRNYVINMALAVGLEAMQEHLAPEVRDELAFLAGDAMSTTRAKGDNTSGEVV